MPIVGVDLDDRSWGVVCEMGKSLGVAAPEDTLMRGLDFLRILVDARDEEGFVSIKHRDGRYYRFRVQE